MPGNAGLVAPLGILMLDTSFERPPGDVGHPATWPFPVIFETIHGASSRMVVEGRFAPIIAALEAAAERAASRGAVGLTTSCGFLAALQRQLAATLPLPILTSSLLQIPLIERCLPRMQRVGVVTYDARSLTAAHFEGAGADPGTPVVGLPPDGRFHALIERGARYMPAELEREVLDACRSLLETCERVGAILFECTNLPPFSSAVRRRIGLPVYDIVTAGTWFRAGLMTGSALEGASP